ncbi:inositol polyphosphate 5-phosphatase Ka [Scyliorhinus torazame]
MKTDKTAKFGLQILTWNVGTAAPPNDVSSLLQLDIQMQEPDMYIIGLQEVNSKLSSFLIDLAFNDPWTILFTTSLAPQGYVKITSIRMQGVLLLIFVKCLHLPYIRDLETNYTRTGLFGYWGNKGGVVVRLSIYGHLICFLNCHLPAHIENTNQRLDSFERILDMQQFTGRKACAILDHDLVFWFGDLNFRIADHGLHFIRECITKKRYHLLWDKDQLNNAKKTRPILDGFLEGQLLFKPTYKFSLDSTQYDSSGKKRKPAWTDRILWKVKECPQAGGTEAQSSQSKKPINVVLNIYDSQMEYGISDHKPVLGTFCLEFEKQVTRPLVELEPKGVWVPGRDAVISYCMLDRYPSSTWDWIGLFKVGFRSHSDYVTYIWVKDDELMVSDDICQVYLSGEDIPRAGGEFVLCYYSSNMESIVGLSSTFHIMPECAENSLGVDDGMDVSCDSLAQGD